MQIKALCGIFLGLCSALVQAQSWQLAKDEQGVKVYLASVAGSAYKAYRGEVEIKRDMPSLIALQEDVAGSCRWIYACSEQRLLKDEGSQAWLYSRFSMPWPVKARDSIVKLHSENTASGGVIRHIKGESHYLPEQKGYVRVREAQGFWQFEPVGEGLTRVVYQLHTEPGGSVPSWLANSFVVDAPYETLKALRQLAEKP